MPGLFYSPDRVWQVVAFLRSLSAGTAAKPTADAARGAELFKSRGCQQCHRINGEGGRLGPDLSDIGAVRTLAALQRALVQPAEALLPIHRTVRIVTKDGRRLTGRRLNEDTYTVQIIDEQENLQSLEKASLRELTVDPQPKMPSYAQRLSADELADVVAYLVSLKGL